MKAVNRSIAAFILSSLMVFCCSCNTLEKQSPQVSRKTKTSSSKPEPASVKPTAQPDTKTTEKKSPPANTAKETSDIVAEIGDYVIRGPELRKEIIQQLKAEAEPFVRELEPVTTSSVLTRMVADKAMIMDARERKLTKNEKIQDAVKRFERKKLTATLFKQHLQGKVKVTDEQIEQILKKNPKWDRKQAEATAKRNEGKKLAAEYYNQLYEETNVEKVTENFPQASKIYKRLLLESQKNDRLVFLRIKQVKGLPDQEKNVVLAIFNSGKITVGDWLNAITDMSPPSRPRNLYTNKGVEKILDKAIGPPILIAEAKAQGLNKEPQFLQQLKNYEDRILFYHVQSEKTKNSKPPIDEITLKNYFKEHPECFKSPHNRLKIDRIFCDDLKTAKKAKAELDDGKDFEIVKQEYSIDPDAKIRTVSFDEEKSRFDDLWKAEPNQIVGPMKSVYRDNIKWRLVKILEKTPGKTVEYDEQAKRNVGFNIEHNYRQTALAEYRKQLLEKYPHKIYTDRVKIFDPFNIP